MVNEMNEIHTIEGLAPEHTLVLFGATGDLARRKLYPALYHMHMRDMLPERVSIVGTARRALSDEAFVSEVRQALLTYGKLSEQDLVGFPAFAKRLHYQAVHADRKVDYTTLHERVRELERDGRTPNRLFYLAMAPEFFGDVALSIAACGLSQSPGFCRLIIEKPFGRDFETAQALNEQLRQAFAEEDIYRIDHYLGKEMVQNIEVIRFANSMFEPLWNNRSIANVQITSSETVGVEDRASYYEGSGALRDMVQNHMLQMVMMIAMEPPSRLKTEAIRDEKVKVLRSLRRYGPHDVKENVVRGQYTAGVKSAEGQTLPGYRQEHGVNAASQTETFVAARLFIDNFRWAGVPFYLRTGKRMALKSTEIVIQFRDMPRDLYFNRDGQLGPNLLVIRVNPAEGMYMQLNAKKPGTEGSVVPIAMEFSQDADNAPEAYERLLYDAMRGDSTFFTRWDEVSLAWKFVDPIAEAFREGAAPLETYEAGTWGPDLANALVEKDGYRWWPVYGKDTSSVEDELLRQQARTLEVAP